MPELSNLNISGMEAVQDALQNINESAKGVSENFERTGELNDKYLEQYGKMSDTQKTIMQDTQSYLGMMTSILANLTMINAKEMERLQLKKDQLQTTKEQDMAEQMQQKLMPGGAPAAGGQSASGVGGQISGAILHPINSLARQIGKLSGPLGIGLMVGAAVGKELGKVVSEMRQVTRAGGMGLEEGMGMGGAAEIEAQRRWATLSIPFLKEQFSTKQEMQQGLGTMFGAGGIRGGGLVEVMRDLPQTAYEAGMKFTEVAAIMAMSSRVLKLGPTEMRESFDAIVVSAKELGYSIKEYADSVYKLATESKAYGVELDQVNTIQKETYQLVVDGKITQSEWNSVIMLGVKAHMDSNKIIEMLNDAAAGAGASLTNMKDQMDIQRQVMGSVVEVLGDTEEAQKKGEMAALIFGQGVAEGSFQMQTYTGVVKDLTSTFHMSDEAGIAFAKGVNSLAMSVGMAAPELSRNIVDLGKTFQRITHEPGQAMSAAGAVTRLFAGNIKNLDVSFSDLNGMVDSLHDRFNATTGEIVAFGKYMIDLGKATDTPTKNIIQWSTQLGDSTRELFDGPREAMYNAVGAMGAYTGMLADGKMTVEDYNKTLRTQIDTFGGTATDAKNQFDTLAKIVNTTNVRMSELSTQAESLSKINRQYGYDQQASNALLVLFNSQLRAGATSLQDLQVIMKGASGMSEGMRATMASEMIGQEGVMGDILRQGGVLGAIDVLIPDIQRYIQGGDMTGALEQALEQADVTERGGALKGMLRKELGGTRTAAIERLMQAAGPSKSDQLAFFKRLSPAIFGQNIESYGVGLENLQGLAMGRGISALPEELDEKLRSAAEKDEKLEKLLNINQESGKLQISTVEQLNAILKRLPEEEDKNTRELRKIYGDFGGDVKNFGSYVGRFASGVGAIGGIMSSVAQIKTMSEASKRLYGLMSQWQEEEMMLPMALDLMGFGEYEHGMTHEERQASMMGQFRRGAAGGLAKEWLSTRAREQGKTGEQIGDFTKIWMRGTTEAILGDFASPFAAKVLATFGVSKDLFTGMEDELKAAQMERVRAAVEQKVSVEGAISIKGDQQMQEMLDGLNADNKKQLNQLLWMMILGKVNAGQKSNARDKAKSAGGKSTSAKTKDWEEFYQD